MLTRQQTSITRQSLKIFQINEIARRAAAVLRVSARLLPAPALVENESLRAALFAEVSVRPVAEAWRKLDVAVVGIGRKLDPTYWPSTCRKRPCSTSLWCARP